MEHPGFGTCTLYRPVFDFSGAFVRLLWFHSLAAAETTGNLFRTDLAVYWLDPCLQYCFQPLSGNGH